MSAYEVFLLGGGFGAGVVVGFILAWLWKFSRGAYGDVTITSVTKMSSPSTYRVVGTATPTGSGNVCFRVHAAAFDNENTAPGPSPMGAPVFMEMPLAGGGFTLDCPRSDAWPAPDVVIVWGSFGQYSTDSKQSS